MSYALEKIQKLKSTKPKRNVINLYYNNDFTLFKVVNDRPSIQKEHHQQSFKNSMIKENKIFINAHTTFAKIITNKKNMILCT